MTPASKAQQKAVNKYMRENYDRINLTVPKGRKDEIKTHAQRQEESVNGFINRAIDETIERDNSFPAQKIAQETAGATKETGIGFTF